jgi:hypothetical protein
MTMGEARDSKPELSGVGGWLTFLCVSLVAFVPIVALVQIVIVLGTPGGNTVEQTINVVVYAALGAFAVFAGIGLIQIWPNALRLAKAYLFANLVIGLLNVIALIAFGADIVSVTRSGYRLLGVLLWLGYLYRSERVRNTYGKNTVRDAAEVFR